MSDESPSGINLERVLSLLRRRGPVVLLCVVIAAGSAFAFGRHQAKKYTATASVLFNEGNNIGLLASGLGGLGGGPPNQGQLDTNVALVGSGDVAAKTAAQMGRHWSPGKVKGSMSISGVSDTNFVSIAATAPNPVIAQKLANTYATTFVTEQQQQTAAQIQTAQRLVNAQYNALSHADKVGTQGIALANRAQALAILGKLGSATVTVSGTASRPGSPSSPNVKRDTLLGAVLGLLIGLVIAFLLERFDPRIRDPKDLEAVYELPLLAAVPKHKDYKVLETLEHTSPSDQLSPYDEVFKLLRSYLRYYAVDRELRTLLVISADPGEGKTTTCYNLAKAAAVLGSRVLLIEGDLRHSTPIGDLLGRPEATLPDVLSGRASMLDALHAVHVGPKAVLDVLVAGNVPPANAGELIGSEAMDFLLAQAGEAYDLVVIDTPPLSLVADAVPLLTKVDGVIVIGRMGKSRLDAAEQLRDKLIGLRAPVLGVVANQVRASEATGYRRRYGYGYGYRDGPRVASVNGSASLNGAARAAGSAPPAGVRPPGEDE